MSAVTLCSEGLADLNLNDPDTGWITTAIDAGAPQVRASVFDRPDGNGTIDRTRLAGARAVTLGVSLCEGPATIRDLVDRLAPFAEPGRRSTLSVDFDGDVRTLPVRMAEVPVPWQGQGAVRVSVPLVTVGSPFWLGTLKAVSLTPAVPAEGSGATPPLTPPVTLTGAAEGEVGAVVNAGSTAAHWIAEIEGPVDDVQVRNLTLGETVALTGLELGSGQIAVVDSLNRTVTVDGESRFAAVDTSVSTWWLLPTGTTQVDAPSTDAGTPARMFFRWHDTYLL